MSAENILVVEDDKLVRRVLKSHLAAEGYQVTGAATVADALRAIRAQLPDLIILDLTLLDEDPFGGLSDGFAFLQLVRRNFRDANFPVIIHSVDNSPGVAERARANGVYAVFQKGDDLTELLTTVRQALDEQANQAA